MPLRLQALALEVPLTVAEPVGVLRQAAPVSSGVCLPRGACKANQPFSLWADDTELPAQLTPLVVEPDGSLRWVLVDFQTDLGARQTRRFTLRDQPTRAKADPALRVSETDQAVRIHTGPMELVIRKDQPFALFDEVRLRGQRRAAGGEVGYVDARTGRTFLAGKPARLVWEYRGPLRVTLRVEGDYEHTGQAGLRYITRLTAWAGRADLRVQHILANSNPEQVHHANLERAWLAFGHELGAGATATAGLSGTAAGPGAAPGVSAALAEGATLWLHQGKESHYYGQPIADAAQAGVNDAVKWTGAETGGWLTLARGPESLWVCDRDFTGDPPRRLEADARQVRCEFVSRPFSAGRGVPFKSQHCWLYDLSHKTAELWLDFAPRADGAALALGARARLLALAPPDWYSQCDVFGVGPFGSLEDEKQVYRQWGWKFDEKQLPRSAPAPGAFVRWEDNHYESEADSAEALLLMAIRTGQRGFFDRGEAWARYHANLHAWRTDGWVYDDGAIWFPQGGPLGTKPARKPAAFKYQHWGKGSGDDQELWHLVQAKSCYCHFYGAGLVDAFLLTGERDFLEAALDLAEQKNSEFRKHRRFTPGKTTIDDTRGFGRGFYVITHLLEAVPDNAFVGDLARLCRDVLWHCPNLDERGFAPCHIGTGFGGFDLKRDLPAEMRAFMDKEGIRMDDKGWLSDRAGRRWPVVCLGGTWQHFYVAAAAERYARLFGDEDMADFAEAFGRFAARFLLSEKCRQTWYYAYMDVPIKGRPWDPWQFVPAHTATTNGDGCVHDGYYTRFFPDAMAKAFSLAGDPALLTRAREFWHYGSKRGYQRPRLSAGWEAVGAFAGHVPPKDDTVLSTSRMFYEWAHPRADTEPPAPVTDLRVRLLGQGQAEVQFTAPADRGGGRVARYQVKCAALPIVAYDDYDFARDDGLKRSFWRAVNLAGEPAPSAPGAQERFVVTGVPDGPRLHFVVASHDTANNRSDLSNVVRLDRN